MVVNIEDAGFEIRDQIMWIYGSGFPKSHNIGKSFDKKNGNEREIIGTKNDFALDGKVRKPDNHKPMSETINSDQKYGYKQGWETPVDKGSSQYEGWGSALKPANEPICLARKPLSEKTIVDNVIKWGTGGINVDGCRIDLNGDNTSRKLSGANDGIFNCSKVVGSVDDKWKEGRFPANILFDEEAAQVLDEQSGKLSNQSTSKRKGGFKTEYVGGDNIKKYETDAYNDKGGASRFFYVAKVSKKERNLGLDNFEDKEENTPSSYKDGVRINNRGEVREPVVTKNNHPTLKPINLMTYLCRLITPPGGIVLDPFMGSGSTGISACLEGFRFVGMELDEDYFKIAEARVNNFEEYRKLLKK
jgi:site-specific DNA-methyltransferase (adenine-specific)